MTDDRRTARAPEPPGAAPNGGTRPCAEGGTDLTTPDPVEGSAPGRLPPFGGSGSSGFGGRGRGIRAHAPCTEPGSNRINHDA